MTRLKKCLFLILSAVLVFSACQVQPPPPSPPPPQNAIDFKLEFEQDDDMSKITIIDMDKGINSKRNGNTEWERIPSNSEKFGKWSIGCYYNTDEIANDDWFVLPLMRISDSSELTFYATPLYEDVSEEEFEVRILQDLNLSEIQEKQPLLSVKFSAFHESNNWVEYSEALSNYSGKTVYIAFRCISNQQYCLKIDNITVTNATVQ